MLLANPRLPEILMSKKLSFLFVSTNGMWSGSEVLWYNAALRLCSQGHSVTVATYYKNNNIAKLAKETRKHLYLQHRFIIPAKVYVALQKHLYFIRYLDSLWRLMRGSKFHLVVISQGNNISSYEILQLCRELKARFTTVTQLVTQFHFLHMPENVRLSLLKSYLSSMMNFFVSQQNLSIHNLMIGHDCLNSKVIHNPIASLGSQPLPYPPLEMGYQIAYVGRIEAFHKGLDLLVQVISQTHWIKRQISFNFYGDGPHRLWLEECIAKYRIGNAFVHGPINDIASIWRYNHFLILPSRMEGQSLALLEALACSRAAIVTDVGGARTLIDDNRTGFIASQPTPACIDDALERAWDARERWQEIGLQARSALLGSIQGDPIDLFIKELMLLVN